MRTYAIADLTREIALIEKQMIERSELLRETGYNDVDVIGCDLISEHSKLCRELAKAKVTPIW